MPLLSLLDKVINYLCITFTFSGVHFRGKFYCIVHVGYQILDLMYLKDLKFKLYICSEQQQQKQQQIPEVFDSF